MSENAALYAALAAFQAAVPPITKTKVGTISGRNRQGQPYSYEYKYADLADVLAIALPLLARHGLCLFQSTTTRDAIEYLNTVLAHTSGASVEGEYTIGPVDLDMQSRGSRMSYARRYAACALLGISPDEDADGLSEEAPAKGKAKPTRAAVVPASSNAEPSTFNRLATAIKKAASITVLDKLMGQKTTVAAVAGLDNIEVGLIRSLEATRRAEFAGKEKAAGKEDAPPAPDHRNSQLAAILAHEPRFWAFARERHYAEAVIDEASATDWLRNLLNISTRTLLDAPEGVDAATALHDLNGEYLAWTRAT